MGPGGLGTVIQLASSLALWPAAYIAWKWAGRLRLPALIVLAGLFIGISSATYRMVDASPARPEVILLGAPDGEARALVRFTRPAPDVTRIELSIWRRSDPAARRTASRTVASRLRASALELGWIEDSKAAVLDLAAPPEAGGTPAPAEQAPPDWQALRLGWDE